MPDLPDDILYLIARNDRIEHCARLPVIKASTVKECSAMVCRFADLVKNLFRKIGNDKQSRLLIPSIEHADNLSGSKLENNAVEGLVPAE